ARDFVVHAGEVEVVVVGTRFSVERGEVVIVAVSRGAVEIRHEGASVVVSAGEIWRQPEEVEPAAEHVEPAPETETANPEAEIEVAAAEESTTSTRPSATRLFEAAQVARRDGRHDEASRKYAEFLRHYPSHNNASLAAFELGRLKMDVLHDPAGAARAFGRAARRGSPFRQDAMARQAQALAASGDDDGCARARSRYEEAFPSGRHLAGLAGVCE
ncbi:MAG: tol-pal system YbgF family protein, partial [Polyangiales bacterium]